MNNFIDQEIHFSHKSNALELFLFIFFKSWGKKKKETVLTNK